MKNTFLILLTLIFTQVVSISQVRFDVIAPHEASYNQNVRIHFTLKNADVKNIKLPKIEGGVILDGPIKSTSSRREIVNGRRVVLYETTFTYVVKARNSKYIKIGSAKVTTTKNRKYSTPNRTIKIVNRRGRF